MPRLDNSIDIKAPREKVFQYISNLEARPEWVKWAKRVELTSPQTKGVGATDVMLVQVGPRKEEVEGLITEYREGQFITRRTTRGMDMIDRLTALDLGETTKVAWSIEYTPPMGPMGKLMDMLVMVRLFDQLMKDSLDILRDNLETAR